jgi:hypothetical protein
VEREGFSSSSDSLDVRSVVPIEKRVTLTIAALSTSVTVSDSDTVIDPHRTGSVNRIGSETLKSRTTSLPGRSLQDVMNSQSGWLYEGNVVLHPRGSEYQTQIKSCGQSSARLCVDGAHCFSSLAEERVLPRACSQQSPRTMGWGIRRDVDEWCGWRSNARVGITQWRSDSR